MSTCTRIMLTRSEEDCAAWASELTRRGAEAIVFPCIEAVTSDDAATRALLAAALETADWLVFTSQRGVAAFVALHGAAVSEHIEIAAVGDATAAAATRALGRVSLTGTGTAADLAGALVAAAAPSRNVLLALAANAGATLEDALAAAGHRVTRVDVYRTIPKPELRPKRRLSTFAADCVFLASPSASRGFTNQIELDCDARIVTIGPTTTAAARAHGLRATRQARTPSLSGLLEASECA